MNHFREKTKEWIKEGKRNEAFSQLSLFGFKLAPKLGVARKRVGGRGLNCAFGSVGVGSIGVGRVV